MTDETLTKLGQIVTDLTDIEAEIDAIRWNEPELKGALLAAQDAVMTARIEVKRRFEEGRLSTASKTERAS